LGQVDAEDDPEETVRDRSDRLLDEDELSVSIDPVSEAHDSTAQSVALRTPRAART